jgi:diguanylate cyclase (GGDEF)-like protein/PAS domain S-box-containing protein
MKHAVSGIRPLFFFSPLAFVILCAHTLVQSRGDVEARAALTSDNINNLIGQNIASTIASYDLSLQGVTERLAEITQDELSPRLQNLVLFDKAGSAAAFNDLFITDENGNILRQSSGADEIGQNVANTDYFKAQANQRPQGLYIGKPFNNGLSHHTWAIPLSRRIVMADGSFGGIVFGSLNIDYVINVFNSVELGKDSAVTIIGADGTLIARHPFKVEDIGLDMSKSAVMHAFSNSPKGAVEVRGLIDGIMRLYRYRQIADLPLVVSVGQSRSSIMAAWWERTFFVIALVALIGTMLLAAFHLLRQQVVSRRQAERALRESEERYRLLSENSSDAMMLRALDGTRLFATSALARLTGYTLEQLSQRRLEDCVPPEYTHVTRSTVDRIAAGEKIVNYEFPFQRADGSWIWIESNSNPSHDASGNLQGIITTMRDVTERKRREIELASSAEKMSAFALIDALTNIGNRRSFDLALEREWQYAQAHGNDLCVAMIDVDHFKKYNDRFGHLIGDTALKRVAAAIVGCLRRPSDFGARYGGEEFALILPNTQGDGALAVLENIRVSLYDLAIDHPDGTDGRITISIGLAVFAAGLYPHPADLIAAADQALYEAKNAGRNSVKLYRRDLRQEQPLAACA